MTTNLQLVPVPCIYFVLWLCSQNLGHHLVTVFSVLVQNINVSNGLNLISTLRSVKKPPKVNYSAVLPLCCLFLHICTAATMVRCSYEACMHLSGYQKEDKHGITSCKEKNEMLIYQNLEVIEICVPLEYRVSCTRRNNKVIRKSEEHYLVFIYSVWPNPWTLSCHDVAIHQPLSDHKSSFDFFLWLCY